MAQESCNSLFILGMNHRVAEVEVRGRFALSETERCARREALEAQGLTGNVLLSTCNRTELYGAFREEPDPHHNEVCSVLFPDLDADVQPYWHTGWNTVFHLFRVSAGLDSMIVGESEILRQIKLAFEESMAAGASGRVLTDLFRQSLEVGKRIRTETQIALGSLSVAATAVKLAKKIFGSFADRHVLIVGAGTTGAQAAKHVASEPVGKLVVLNRTVEKAESLANQVGVEFFGLDRLQEQLHLADVVISAVEAPSEIIQTDMLKGAPRQTRCLVDISVPRSISPDISTSADVFHFDIDDLTQLIQSAKHDRDEEAQKSKKIVVAEVHKFLAKQHFTELAPLVREMQTAFDETLGKALTEATSTEFSTEAEKLAKRLLGVSLNTLKLSSRAHVSVEQVQGAYELFLKEFDR